MELFDIIDENGNPTGKIVERSIAHAEGIPHRTAHIWIIRRRNEKTEILLQKRSRNKDSFPGKFDTSSAGHIQAGDEPMESALRELEENWESMQNQLICSLQENSPYLLPENFMEKYSGMKKSLLFIFTITR